jgi:ribosomal protein S18 acetylase RimI-like enzyme
MSEDELEYRLRMQKHSHLSPIYHADTDLCVAAPDGTFIAGCEALIDVHNREADIERVCTHSQFRRRGFARAVILECLVRLQAMGMKKAHITGYSDAAIRLYGSFDRIGRTEHYIYKHPNQFSS